MDFGSITLTTTLDNFVCDDVYTQSGRKGKRFAGDTPLPEALAWVHQRIETNGFTYKYTYFRGGEVDVVFEDENGDEDEYCIVVYLNDYVVVDEA